MAETTTAGRHRAAGRHNPLSELTGMVARAGESGVKASAVLAASGGLIAAFALPAQAATAAPAAAAKTTLAAKPAAPVAPVAVPAAPAVVAPQAAAPIALASVGVVGVSAIEKPAPPPPPPVVATPAPTQQASRTAARASTATRTAPSTAPAAEKPAATWVAPSAVGGSVLDIAAAYSGIWYVYGGTTPAGFDCSGFTQFVFAQAGVSLPRTATQQLHAVQRVSDPQPGDLVFAMSGGIATHVGIYAGNGMQYDSPRTGKQSGLHQIWSTNVVYGRP